MIPISSTPKTTVKFYVYSFSWIKKYPSRRVYISSAPFGVHNYYRNKSRFYSYLVYCSILIRKVVHDL